MVGFSTEDPLASLTRLKHVEGHAFRRIRSDKALGEEITFEVENGRVARMQNRRCPPLQLSRCRVGPQGPEPPASKTTFPSKMVISQRMSSRASVSTV